MTASVEQCAGGRKTEDFFGSGRTVPATRSIRRADREEEKKTWRYSSSRTLTRGERSFRVWRDGEIGDERARALVWRDSATR